MSTDGKKRRAVRAWMERRAAQHTDPMTGEVDATSLVEAWDRECADGGETLDPTHVAWEVAVDVAASCKREPRPAVRRASR
jgi:hypothetical protein